MDEVRVIFAESLKALGLAFLALLAVKAVSGLKVAGQKRRARRVGPVKVVLYLAILVMVIVGARNVGYNVAAGVYRWASEDNLRQSEIPKAYANALRAVSLRPGTIANWRALAMTKLVQHQFESLLEDLPAFQSLAGGDLDEEDAYHFALCYFYLGQYDKLMRTTEQLIARNRSYAAPYILQGLAYTALGKRSEAEWSFMAVLQMFPNHQAAVEGLSHEFFLEGRRDRALAILNETAKYHFPPETRARFEDLKRFYAQ